ncbi:Cu,Zn superoxide dismutase-like protein [Periconia macrospinosa]|uniref:Cu,Zn superoxide dismutase-like protein n=1 Tax=Periconia macrospinosa TaxID=97972 RepID=A0A2V1E7A4_9PLEO|nr:Cu,Zn superoxide dismutase-like protein [Periconia macrospinosa]
MRSSTITSVLSVAATASATTLANTPKAENNPAGAHYKTEFDYVDQTGVWGFFELKSGADGKTVDLNFKFNGIAKSKGGPFTYHIHQNPLVGRDCATTGGHFDPYGVGTANCKEGQGALCEVGDLSGRFRPISVEANVNENSFSDQYMSLDPKNKAFVGDKSFVIHNANSTRVACGNFVKINGGNTGSTPSQNGTAAPQTTGNPAGVVYRADIDWLDQNGIDGFFEAKAGKDGKGTELNYKFNNLTGPGAPYAYHIHEKPVTNRDCNSTAGHLNPYKAPAKCSGPKENCEVGDLSGKYGTVDAKVYAETFVEPYLSIDQGNPAFIGDKSIVIHDKDGKRVACASFMGKLVKPDGTTQPLPAGGVPGSSTNGTSGTNGTVTTPGSPPSTGPGSPSGTATGPALSQNAGSKLVASSGALLMAFAAFLL